MLKSLFLTPVTKRHVERKILRTHPLHLFRIIQDVDAYQYFLPLCTHSQILDSQKHHHPDDNHHHISSFQATLTVGLPPLFEETYVSQVVVDSDKLTVESRSIQSNLFDSLKSRWKLSDATFEGHDQEDKQCHVDFEVEMSVSDPLVCGVLDQVLSEVAGRQVASFEKRCQELPLPNDLHTPKQ